MLISRMLSATMIAGAPDTENQSPPAAGPAPVLTPMPASRLGMIGRRRPRARSGTGHAQAPAAGRGARGAAVHSH